MKLRLVRRSSKGFMISQQLVRGLKLIDLSKPHLWLNSGRKRQIVCHVGPTNSGKTYNALLRLSECKRGLYCGPLRLLAWEISESMRKNGIKCNLLTGNEKDIYPCGGTHTSSTIEMADLVGFYDVVVIDEAQLLGDFSRGWAWTQAFLGAQANEIHLCGSPSMLPIVEELCNQTNDELVIKRYDRLSPLRISQKPLQNWRNIRKGDCVVGFSRKVLYDIKQEIEFQNPGIRCCVIYGNLPPEARREQAKLFSDPQSGFDVLVASDAIGMGLNLAIRRIVFSTVTKFDGFRERKLHSSELKQIAGRAGRFGSAYAEGEVACLHKSDIKHMVRCMEAADKPIRKAGLFPSLEQLQLLGTLVGHRVDDKTISSFWADFYSAKYGVDIGPAHCVENTVNLSRNLYGDFDFDGEGDGLRDGGSEPFSSVAYRASEHHSPLTIPDRRPTAGSDSSIHSQLGPYSSLTERGLSSRTIHQYFKSISVFIDKLENFLHHRNQEDADPLDDQSAHQEGLDQSDIQSAHRSAPMAPPFRPTLSKLLSMFKKKAEMDSSGLYFLCDLNERKALAAVVDDEPSITFRNRYLLSMAPVNVDDDLHMDYFRRFTVAFANSETVSLDELLTDVRPPKTPTEMLMIERKHRILDTYLWLAMRYPDKFSEADEALEGRQLCSSLLDTALKSRELSKAFKVHKAAEKESRSRNKKEKKKALKNCDVDKWKDSLDDDDDDDKELWPNEEQMDLTPSLRP